MKKSIFIALCLTAILTLQTAFGQQEQALNFLTDTWQAHLTNPALLPSKKISVALPSVYFNVNSPDLKFNDLIINENGKRRLYLNNLYAAERPEVTRINAHVQVQTLGIAFPVTDKLSLSVYQAGSTTPSVNYRRDLAQLFFKGNAEFLGKTVAFGSSASADVRSEIGIGATYRLPALTIGGRVKLHSGIAGIFVQNDKVDATFSQTDYSMNFNTDIDVRTFAGDKIFKVKRAQDVVNQGLFSNNRGLSFDLGASMKLGKLQLNASLIDIAGSINWKNEGTTYVSKGDFTLKGRNETNFQNFFKVDSLSSSTFADTLKKIVGLTETASFLWVASSPRPTSQHLLYAPTISQLAASSTRTCSSNSTPVARTTTWRRQSRNSTNRRCCTARSRASNKTKCFAKCWITRSCVRSARGCMAGTRALQSLGR